MTFSVVACLGSVDHACRYVIVDGGSVLLDVLTAVVLDDVVDVVGATVTLVGAVLMVEDG